MRTDEISLLGGGWSAGLIDRTRLPGEVIGVNEAAVLAPCRWAVSMDRLWTENRFAALAAKVAAGDLELAYLRRSAVKNVDQGAPWIRIFENDHLSADFSEEPYRLNGTNSGLCAFNLAYQLRPRKIVLFGFDMNRSPAGRAYWFDDYPWAKPGGATTSGKYRAWAAEFEIAAAQCRREGIEVLNASPTSAIDAFPKVRPEEVLV